MLRVRGRFDGQQIVLDQPVPAELRANTPVKIVALDGRDQALREFRAFLETLWARPIPPPVKPSARRWKREDLHDRD